MDTRLTIQTRGSEHRPSCFFAFLFEPKFRFVISIASNFYLTYIVKYTVESTRMPSQLGQRVSMKANTFTPRKMWSSQGSLLSLSERSAAIRSVVRCTPLSPGRWHTAGKSGGLRPRSIFRFLIVRLSALDTPLAARRQFQGFDFGWSGDIPI